MTSSFFNEFAHMVSQYPDHIALIDLHDRSLTYLQLEQQIVQKHAWLTSIGIKPNDKVVALLPNSIECAVIFLACLRGGFIYAPLPCTSTLAEIMRWKKRMNASYCLLADPVSHQLQQQIKELDWRVEIIAAHENKSSPKNNIIPAENTGFLVMQSSGSTGEPKAILLSGDRLWASAKAFLHFHMGDHDAKQSLRFWNYLPMSYLGGLFNLLLIPLAAGGSALIDDAFNGKTFLHFWHIIDRYQINCIWLVPSILRGLLSLSERINQKRTYPTISFCFLGTAPIFKQEKDRFFAAFGIQPLENYGLSETTFIASEHQNQIENRTEGSVGCVMPDVEMELRSSVDAQGQAESEVWVKTPYAMVGYLDENGVAKPIVDERGFMPTGDFGKQEDNQLILGGRKRDIIKKGGVLILLREIELLLSTYPNVSDVAAVRMDHPFYGESFNLHICTNDDKCRDSAFQDELTAWLHKQLTKEKWPEKIVFHTHFPRTSTGKIQKHLLEVEKTIHA